MRVGFAFRSSVFHPSRVKMLAPLVEESGVDSIWFPDAGGSFDAVDLCAVALGSTTSVRVGTGVIRAGDHDPRVLALRARTLDQSSGGRFVLGLGAGRERGSSAIHRVVETTEKFRSEYGTEARPAVYFAALRGGMLRAAMASADGALLNFCPPSHAERIIPRVRPRNFTVACYVKLFFSEKGDAEAKRMLIDEVTSYNRFPSYHDMFEAAGLAGPISGLGQGGAIPPPLLEVSLPNPSEEEVADHLRAFVRAGVDLPVLYPYVSGDADYQTEVVRKLASAATASP